MLYNTLILYGLSLSIFLQPLNGFVGCVNKSILAGAGGVQEKYLREIKVDKKIVSKYKLAPSRLIILRDDGALRSPQASHDETLKARALLASLTSDAKNRVWVLSAESGQTLTQLYGDIPKLNIVGRLGSEITIRDGSTQFTLPDVSGETLTVKNSLVDIVKSLGFDYQPKALEIYTGGIKFTHNGNLDPVVSAMRRLSGRSKHYFTEYDNCATLVHKNYDLNALVGLLRSKYGEQGFFAMYFGADDKDEPLFKMIASESGRFFKDSLSVIVSSHPKRITFAKKKFLHSFDVQDFFSKLLG